MNSVTSMTSSGFKRRRNSSPDSCVECVRFIQALSSLEMFRPSTNLSSWGLGSVSSASLRMSAKLLRNRKKVWRRAGSERPEAGGTRATNSIVPVAAPDCPRVAAGNCHIAPMNAANKKQTDRNEGAARRLELIKECYQTAAADAGVV